MPTQTPTLVILVMLHVTHVQDQMLMIVPVVLMDYISMTELVEPHVTMDTTKTKTKMNVPFVIQNVKLVALEQTLTVCHVMFHTDFIYMEHNVILNAQMELTHLLMEYATHVVLNVLLVMHSITITVYLAQLITIYSVDHVITHAQQDTTLT